MYGAESSKRIVEDDRFARYTGIRLVEARPGYAKASLEVEEKHLNGAGFVQGGAIFTLADFAFAAASNEGENPTLGINASISYVRGPKGRVITAEARKASATNRLCTYEVAVYDQDGALAAKMLATGYIKK
ncbi:MAG: PaaI family thioesterase [Spirochaetia bacterium]|jgi:acyl-CoA thioesterase|nr:PaaI family thioesterase [Spirochaetia bacterium]